MVESNQPTSIQRAWIVASVWCQFHRDRRPEASTLRSLISSSVQEQKKILDLVAASMPTGGADVVGALAALRGDGLSEYLSNSHLGSCRWTDLERATDESARAEVVHLLAGAVSYAHPALADDLKSVVRCDIIQQLAAIWVVWTHPRISPEYLATAALAQHALFGVGRDDLFCVSMRIQGFM